MLQHRLGFFDLTGSTTLTRRLQHALMFYYSFVMTATSQGPGFSRFRHAENMTEFRLTPLMLSQARVIAKGRRIRDVQRLAETYGGRQSKWVKKAGPCFEDAGRSYDEHPDIGQAEPKLKEVSES
jgi:hypothetical protein